jgi:hypothetical protein
MSDKHRITYGPDWLDQFADRMCNNGQELEAVAFRQMVAGWRNDQNALAAAQVENSRLQRRLDTIAVVARPELVEGAPERRQAA